MPTIRDKVKSALSGGGNSSTAASDDDDGNTNTDDDDDVGEQEEKIAQFVELARMIFSKYRLEGVFTITNSHNRRVAPTAQCVKVKINKSDIDNNLQQQQQEEGAEWMESLQTSLDEEDESANNDQADQAVQAAEEEAAVSSVNSEENLVRMQKTVLAMMKKIVKDLMKRAVKYKNKSYLNNIELSSRATVSGPLFRRYSITVLFSATAQALLASRDYRETYKNRINEAT